MAKSAGQKGKDGKCLVIVESPTKARTLRKFLPDGYEVEASMGHVRDLPQSADEIPEKVKKSDWARIGVNWDEDFQPLYVVPQNKKKVIDELKKKIKSCDTLYLATDEDREGESISWHLLEILKPKVPVKRMVFHEITKRAILNALEATRDIDMKLVRAQETRRILDRLVGYTVSPLLWKKIGFGLSAGRVQSVALRLIVERERQRSRFVKAQYWDLEADFSHKGSGFKAKLQTVDGLRVAGGKDFDETTGKLHEGRKVTLLDELKAKALKDKLIKGAFTVSNISHKNLTLKAPIPYITSTLQQDGNRKLGMSAREVMRVAQSLYENGHITYMRTDSPTLSEEGTQGARKAVQERFKGEGLTPEPRRFTSKSKGSQEAHEAIRPAGESFAAPEDLKLRPIETKLYRLIYQRTLACQMNPAKKVQTTIELSAENTTFHATTTEVAEPGWLKAFEDRDDSSKQAVLTQLEQGSELNPEAIEALGHETKPINRYTEASLVQTLEKEGVGRPSTYASIIQTIIDRGYVMNQSKALIPTFKGYAVTQLLERHFGNLVDTNFTSRMEESLDEIAVGSVEPTPYLEDFYLGDEGLMMRVKNKEESIPPSESRRIDLEGVTGYTVSYGRYGPYVVKGEDEKPAKDAPRASLPEDMAPSELTAERIETLIADRLKEPEPIGKSEDGEDIYCLTGPYGSYVQLGKTPKAEKGKKAPKPKRSSLPDDVNPSELSLDQARFLLSLPKELGKHPEKDKPVTINMGRYGPYVKCESQSRSLAKQDSIFSVTLDRAVELLARERMSKSRSVLRELGKHPEDDTDISILEGRYGPYVKYKRVNASIPKDLKVEDVTLEKALELIAEREKRMAEKKKGGKKAPAKKKTAKKKPAAKKKTAAKKKPAAKKTAAKKKPAAKKTTKAASGDKAKSD